MLLPVASGLGGQMQSETPVTGSRGGSALSIQKVHAGALFTNKEPPTCCIVVLVLVPCSGGREFLFLVILHTPQVPPVILIPLVEKCCGII